MKKNVFLFISLSFLCNFTSTAAPEANKSDSPSKLSQYVTRFKKQTKEFVKRFIGHEPYRSEQIQQTRAAVLIPAAALLGGGLLYRYFFHGKQVPANSRRVGQGAGGGGGAAPAGAPGPGPGGPPAAAPPAAGQGAGRGSAIVRHQPGVLIPLTTPLLSLMLLFLMLLSRFG